MNRSISLDGCRIVVYMPTFRNSPNAGRQNTSFSFFHLSGNESFLQYIEQNNIIIVEKAHHVCQVRDELGNNRASDRIVYLKDVSAQELLCSADLLVTDYSGAFFDFLILDRPIIHFLYDYDYYRTKDRGLYYDKEEVLAGEEATDQEQLIQAIKKNMEHPELYSERRKMIRDTYLEYDSAQSCENLYHEIKARLKS